MVDACRCLKKNRPFAADLNMRFFSKLVFYIGNIRKSSKCQPALFAYCKVLAMWNIRTLIDEFRR